MSVNQLQSLPTHEWLLWLSRHWSQGEHVCIMGETGRGKTTLAYDLLAIRDWVVVLGVKRVDETLEKFKAAGGYKLIKKWPPDIQYHRVILWIKPKHLGGLREQSYILGTALNQIYLAGGWCVFIDDAGYVSGYLHMGSDIGIMLNQGRSSHLSVVVAMTQPKSVVARMPSEAFKQCRHQIIFRYTNQVEIKAISEITGIDNKTLLDYMQQMGEHDCIYKGKSQILLIRNTH